MSRKAFFTIWFKPRESIRSLVAERPVYPVKKGNAGTAEPDEFSPAEPLD